MALDKLYFGCLLANLIVCTVWAQGNKSDAIHSVSSSLNQFALNLLSELTERAGDSLNLAVSPYMIWSLMAIIDEGARENTARQIEQVLKIPPNYNKDLFRHSYKSLTNYLLSAENVQVDVSSAIFTAKGHELNRSYQALTKNFYGVGVIPVDFHNLVQSVNTINTYVATATKNRIPNFVNTDDVIDAQIFMTSTMYFKGKWKLPFNENLTRMDSFFDESGNAKGQVMMMYKLGAFPYGILVQLNAYAVELPYGKGDRMSMIVILPDFREKLSVMLKKLTAIPFSTILDTIAESEDEFGPETIKVYLPRFTIESDLNLNEVLYYMGMNDVFTSEKANLLGIFTRHLYITRFIQQSKIEVNEEAIVASTFAAYIEETLEYRAPPPTFHAGRAFAYFIVDKPTKSIIFAGKVTNPNTICDNCPKKN